MQLPLFRYNFVPSAFLSTAFVALLAFQYQLKLKLILATLVPNIEPYSNTISETKYQVWGKRESRIEIYWQFLELIGYGFVAYMEACECLESKLLVLVLNF